MIRCAGLIRGFCFVCAGVWAVPMGVAQTNKGASNAATERRQEQPPPPKRPPPVASAPKTERSNSPKQQPAAAAQTPQTYMYSRPPTSGQPDGPQAKALPQTPVQAKTAPQTLPAMTMPQRRRRRRLQRLRRKSLGCRRLWLRTRFRRSSRREWVVDRGRMGLRNLPGRGAGKRRRQMCRSWRTDQRH